MDYVIGEWDREWFKRCRRAWDLGSPARRNLVPNVPVGPFSCEHAIRDALAVYYYPAMWDWQPFVVRPLVLKAFRDSMDKQRDTLGPAFTDERRAEWERLVALGEGVLEHYFEWAPTVDRFGPLLVATEYKADVVDPHAPDRELVLDGGRAVHFRGRIHLWVVDDLDRYWIVQHRLVEGPWEDVDVLALDDEVVAACWAWERFSLMSLAGMIVNELRAALPRPDERVGTGVSERRRMDFDRKRGSVGQNFHRPRPVNAEKVPPGFDQRANEFFRRTQVPITRDRIVDIARRIGAEALRMIEATDEVVDLVPSPRPDNCRACAYRAPCLAMSDGEPVELVLAERYHERPREAEVGLGGLFGLNPNQLRVREYQPGAEPTRRHKGW